MGVPTRLDFPFYVFSMIYYVFSNIQQKQIKKKKTKPPSKSEFERVI